MKKKKRSFCFEIADTSKHNIDNELNSAPISRVVVLVVPSSLGQTENRYTGVLFVVYLISSSQEVLYKIIGYQRSVGSEGKRWD